MSIFKNGKTITDSVIKNFAMQKAKLLQCAVIKNECYRVKDYDSRVFSHLIQELFPEHASASVLHFYVDAMLT